jgi:hypothetical protein
MFLLPLLFLFAPAFAGEAPFSEYTKVYVAVSANKIGAIQEVEGQFGFDFYFYFTWRDDRRNNTSADFDQSAHFFPSPELMNKADGDDIVYDCSCSNDGPPTYALSNIPVVERSGTWCSCMSRPQVTLDAELILKAFPWDVQSADIVIESTTWLAENLTWIPVASAASGL